MGEKCYDYKGWELLWAINVLTIMNHNSTKIPGLVVSELNYMHCLKYVMYTCT